MAKGKFNTSASGNRKNRSSGKNDHVGTREALFSALRDNDLEKAETLLRKNADPNARDSNGNTALHIAVKADNPAALALLLFYGANPNIENKDHFTPLLEAVWCRKPEAFLTSLINGGADPAAVARDRKNALHIAVKNNYAEIIPFLIKSGVDLNGKDEDGLTPLHYALVPLREAAVTALINAGADPSIPDKRGETALIKAVDYADFDTVALLLRHSACLSTINDAATFDSRETALHIAVKKNRLNVVELLLDAGALINQRDGYRQTPLYLAFDRSLPDMAEFLIARGADVRKCPSDTKYKRHLVHLAAKDERTSLFSLLIEFNGNLHALDEENANALHYAIGPPSIKNIKALLAQGVSPETPDRWGRRAIDLLNFRTSTELIEVAKVLLDAGANPGISNDPQVKVSPLHIAARQENLALIDLLLKFGADPDVKDRMDQATPLIDCARFSCKESAKKLLDAGANPDARDGDGRTALHVAAFAGNDALTELLLNVGANTEIADKFMQTPLALSLKRGYVKPAQLMLKNGARTDVVDNDGGNIFHAAAEDDDNARILPELRAAAPKIDINAADHLGDTPLMRAAKNGRDQMVRAFLAEGADAGLVNKDGETPLMMAIRLFQVDAVHEIIKHRPNEVHHALPGGELPIHIAAGYYSTRLAGVLLDAGADPNVRDDRNKDTPLHIAIAKNQRPMVEFLLTRGADYSIPNGQGITPLQLAEKSVNKEIADLLKAAEKLGRRGKPYKPGGKPPPPAGPRWNGYI